MGHCNSLLIGLGQEQEQHPAMHSGGVSKGRSVAVVVGVSEM